MKRILLSILATMTISLLSADLPKHPPEEEFEKQKKSILEQKTGPVSYTHLRAHET